MSQAFIQALSPLQVFFDEPLAKHTAFRCRGNAMYYLEVQVVDQLIEVVKTAREYSVPLLILGAGTNALFPQGGFNGLIVKNNCRKFEVLSVKGSIVKREMQVSYALMQAESGAITSLVARSAVEQGFSGLEYASGLPGTIGGAIAVNANYPKENRRIGESVYAAKILTKNNEIKEVDQSYFRFGFDYSTLLEEGSILLSVIFKLTPMDKESLQKKAQEVAAYRINTHPKQAVAGMTFRNIDIKKVYKQDENPHNVLPMMLLEKAVIEISSGKVALAKENPRYVLNLDNASFEDVQSLIKTIQERIFTKFCVQLELKDLAIKAI